MFGDLQFNLSSRVDTLYTFGGNITQYKTESVHFLGLMNSASTLPRIQGSRYTLLRDGAFFVREFWFQLS